MDNNKIQMEELETMHTQLNILKAKLEKQEIVNDKMIRQAMATKMNYVERYVWREIYLILPFSALALLPIIFLFGASWWWYAFTMIFLGTDVYADYYINIKRKPNFNDDLIQAAKVLTWQKKIRLKALIISGIILLVWLVWLCAIVWGVDTNGQDFYEGMKYGGIVGMLIGGTIGGVIGMRVFLKMQRINTELIAQIEEITQKHE